MEINGSRDHFFEKVGSILEQEDIYIVSADLAGRPFDPIREKCPNRYVSVGIAEQNMISVASGIALCGKKVIAYAANPFIALRAFDQIRNSAVLMNLPIAIAGLGIGFGVSTCGTTHFVTEDFAIMSLCPNLNIITVSDDLVADYAFDMFLRMKRPLYIRFDKDCSGRLCQNMCSSSGFRYLRREGRELAISIGYMAGLVLQEQPDMAVIDVFSYPFDEDKLLEEMRLFPKIYIYEEQQKRGGLGSAILEFLNRRKQFLDIELIGIDYAGRFPCCYGSREYWLEQYGLTVQKDVTSYRR